MSEIKIINKTDIDTTNDIVYIGWLKEDISNYRISNQSKFLGFAEDMILEVTSDDLTIYYAIFRSGKSFYDQKQFLLTDVACHVIVHVKGIIYRFDIIDRKCFDIDCYANIEFNSQFFTTTISNELGLMTVIDNDGIATITWDGVLWKKHFDYAYADNLKVTAISRLYIALEYDPPNQRDQGVQFIKLDTYTGAVL